MERPDQYVRRVVVTVAILSAVYIFWLVKDVAIIIFGGLIVATLLTALADRLVQWTPLKRKASVAIVLLSLIIAFGLTFYYVGDQAVKQFAELRQTLPQAIETTTEWLESQPFGAGLLPEAGGQQEMEVPWGNVAGYTGTLVGGIANMLLMIVIGVYLAFTPNVYNRGIVRLTPPIYRERTDKALACAGTGLRQWLVGQLLAMLLVGVLTAIGLTVLGIPLALVLGIIAGLSEFVPFIGPLFAGALAIIFAFTEGPTAALHVAILFLALQQLESNVITPLIQRRTVKLPPALGLISVVIFGVLFGIPGILFSTPLMVVAMILVNKLYIEYGLEGETLDEHPPASTEPVAEHLPTK